MGTVSNRAYPNRALTMKDTKSILVVACSAFFISGCGGDSGTDIPASPPSAAKPGKLAAAPISYSEHIGTIFVASCAKCHISDSKGGFSMETFAKLIAGGEEGPVVVAGKPDESKLIKLIESDEMPPEGKGQPLQEDEKKDIREWIAKGAEFDGPGREVKTLEYVPQPESIQTPGGGGGGGGFGAGGGGGERGGRGGGNWNPMERFDKNGDKKISKDELPEQMQERFAEMDTDKDGSLTEEEFRAAMRARFGGGGRGGRGGGERGGRGDGERGEKGGETGAPKEGERPQRPPFEEGK